MPIRRSETQWLSLSLFIVNSRKIFEVPHRGLVYKGQNRHAGSTLAVFKETRDNVVLDHLLSVCIFPTTVMQCTRQTFVLRSKRSTVSEINISVFNYICRTLTGTRYARAQESTSIRSCPGRTTSFRSCPGKGFPNV